MNKEELEDLLSIGCCKYHEEIGEKAKKEIERLNNEIKRQENVITELNDDNEYITDNINSLEVENTRLKSIIKEAIEYIQDRYDGEALTHTFDKCNVKELLEILDKENK